jgi:polyisoprenoid-binding protein YceI
MVSKVRGHFEKFTANVTIDEDVTKSSVNASIEASSITTRDDSRDNHLRSADFFESDKFPTIDFSSTGIRPSGDDWKLLGNLTIRGISKPIELDLEFNGTQADPYGGVRTGFSASGEISRKEFGIEWNAAVDGGGVVVGDKVTINVEAELVKA